MATNPRTAAVWATVEQAVSRRVDQLGRPLRVLDLGGGTGGLAVPLAAQGHQITVVDPSPDALASLRRRATEVDVADRISALQGDTETLADLVEPAGFDLVCCHGTLEVVTDPDAALATMTAAVAPGGMLSLVTAGRLGAVIRRAIAGHIAQAHAILERPDGRWGDDDPVPRRFDAEVLRERLTALGLDVQVHFVRLLTDLVPAGVLDTDRDRQALLQLEEALATDSTESVAHIGAAIHLLGHRPAPS